MATGGGPRLATLHSRPLVLDRHRMVLGVLRTVGVAALSLWLVVLFRRIRLDLGLGFGVEPGLGQLVLVAGLCQLVPLGLLQLMVLGSLPGLGRRRGLLSARRRPTTSTAGQCDSTERRCQPERLGSSADSGCPGPSIV